MPQSPPHASEPASRANDKFCIKVNEFRLFKIIECTHTLLMGELPFWPMYTDAGSMKRTCFLMQYDRLCIALISVKALSVLRWPRFFIWNYRCIGILIVNYKPWKFLKF